MTAALGMAWVTVVAAGALLFRPRGPSLEGSKAAGATHATNPALAVVATVALGAAVTRWPWACLMLAAAALGVAASSRAREQQALERRVAHELPEIIELLRICAEGGFNMRRTIGAVAEVADGEIANVFVASARAASAGAGLADALEECASRLGPAAGPLVSALAASERYGVPLVPSLERLAADARAEERRRGEAHARKVPVRLLFPLVLCILPAFALLTVAPLIAGGLESLRLP